MTYYLILDKTNLIVKSFTSKDDAEDYVKSSPYLKVSEFDDTLNDAVMSNEHHIHTVSDDLPF